MCSFFGLLIYYSMLGKEVIYKYLGFLKGTFAKGLFYIFLASLAITPAMQDLDFVMGWVIGISLCTCAALNMIRYCGAGDTKDEIP